MAEKVVTGEQAHDCIRKASMIQIELAQEQKQKELEKRVALGMEGTLETSGRCGI